MSGVGLDDEIKRVGDSYWNYVEGVKKAQVKSASGNRADIIITDLNIQVKDVPILSPTYGTKVTLSGAPGVTVTVEYDLDVSAGETVAVAFLNGDKKNPIIVGVF